MAVDSTAGQWPGWARVVVGLLLGGLSAACLTLAFPPYGFWPLAFVGLVPAAVAQHRVMPRRLSGLALGLATGGFFWGYFAGMFDGKVWYLEWLPAFIGAIVALMTNGDRAFHERTGYRLFVLHGAAIWVGIEAIRGLIPVIGTGGFLGYALYGQLALIQPASVLGVYGVSVLVLLTNYVLSLGILAVVDGRIRLDPLPAVVRAGLARRWLAGSAAVLVVWLAIGAAMLGSVREAGPAIRAAAVQPGGNTIQDEQVAALYEQTREAAQAGAKLIVWPEGALSVDVRKARTAEVKALARETGAYLVVGHAAPTPGGLRNEATVVSPDGVLLGTFGKDHPLVFFGETSASRGTYPTYQTPLGSLATIICYDLVFTDTARQMAAQGAGLIAVPSNDWPGIVDKEYTFLAFRAVENRAALVKADRGYDSVVVAPTGEIVAVSLSSRPRRDILYAEVAPGRADALYTRLGDVVGWLCLASIPAFIVADQVTRRRSTARAPAASAKVQRGTPV